MGCTTSKLDDLPAVALCGERCAFLDQAIHHRYVFAEAHVAYLHSLKRVGLSLHHFFHHDLINPAADGPPSPVLPLPLPTRRKGDPEPSGSPPPPPPPAAIHHSHSNSNSSSSHLHFHADSESESLHHQSDNISPLHPYGQINYADHEILGSYSGGFIMNTNYMKNKMTSSVVSFEQRPMSSETVHLEESSSSSYYYYPQANYSNQNSYYSYPNYGGGMNSFFGSPPTYGSSSPPPSSSKKPPPSPPRASSWEFLNPFESFDKYYHSYMPSRDSREVREEEGIPDLEDDQDQYQQEVVKKFMDDDGGGKIYAKSVAAAVVVVVDEDSKPNNDHEEGEGLSLSQTRPSVSAVVNNDSMVQVVVDKKVVDNVEKKSGDRENVAAAFKARVGLGGDSEVVKEIQVQFERASDSGSEFSNMLEVGKLPYHRKNAVYQVSSKMLHVITPPVSVVSSQPPKSAESPSPIEKADPAFLDVDEDLATRSKTLSSTLQKLYIWEKKLYDEVKVEEKMRVLHERKSKKLKRLDERGAEAHKVDSTRTLVRSLSTRIRIAIQVVDKISMKINMLRDEELWPQLNQFIQGLTRMWKSMLECHRSQCQAIGEARRLDDTASRKHFSDAQLEATLQLEHELLNWTLRFSCWVGAQKGYVRALNNWLLKCLLYVPEETPDGVVPFSPGRVGAPPVFVICNQWSLALESISEKEVVDSMRDFAMSVLQLWEQDMLEMRQRMMANKDLDRKVKNLERVDQKIQKEFQALDKQLVLVSGDGNGLSVAGHVVYQSETSKSGNLQVSLLRIFEAMERFTANSLKAYEELMQRIEEDGLAGE